MSDESCEAMNRSGLVRAWPFAVISLLAVCLALGVLGDLGWLAVLAILALGIFGTVHVVREAARNGGLHS